MVKWWKRGAVAVVMATALSVAPGNVCASDNAVSNWSVPSTADKAPQESPFNTQSSVLRMVGGLFLCLGMFGCGIHVYRRYVLPRTGSTQRRLQLVERLQISQKSSLVLVKLDGKEFIMSTGAESSRLVPLTSTNDELFDEALNGACQDVGEYNA